jgi:hypothetical protein
MKSLVSVLLGPIVSSCAYHFCVVPPCVMTPSMYQKQYASPLQREKFKALAISISRWWFCVGGESANCCCCWWPARQDRSENTVSCSLDTCSGGLILHAFSRERPGNMQIDMHRHLRKLSSSCANKHKHKQ